jgi:hypothetical protein
MISHEAVLNMLLEHTCKASGPDDKGFGLYCVDLCCAKADIRAKSLSNGQYEIAELDISGCDCPQQLRS